MIVFSSIKPNYASISAFIVLLLFNGRESYAQNIKLEKNEMDAVHVSMSKVTINDKQALRVIKDSVINLADEPTFVRIKEINFSNGTIEVKVLSRLLKNAPEYARGFIGIAFRINEDNTKYESIYLRPLNARADDQVRRNHSIQYYAYPDYKFDRLRKEYPEKYESHADLQMNKWITMRIEIKGVTAKLFIDKNKQPSLVINDLKLGANVSGGIGLWVDIGTEGYFADLKVKPD